MISAEVKGTANVKQEQIKRIQLTKSVKHGKSYLLMVPKIYALWQESCVNAMKIFTLSFANHTKLCKYSLELK